jgi:predicted small lipoprotein YifL
MKKKFFDTVLSAVLAAVMLSSLAACGGGGGETTPVGDETVFDTQQETTSQQTTQSNEVVATIEETVMWDNEDIKVTALNLTSNQYYHILNLRIENKTGRDLYVMASRTAVNSFVVEPIMGADVPANSTVEDEFKIWLKDVDAKVIADIETRFSYSSSDRYLNRTTERVKLETSAAASHDYSYDESGTVLYDADGIKIICQGFNDEGNPMIYLSSTGELSEGCCVEAYKVYVNGKETYASYCEWVFTNTRNVAELELDDEDRDGNELGEVESLEVSFKINKENMADRSPVRTELVEIPVK